MFYCAIQGFVNGNTAKIWRATDSNATVCGEPGGLAEAYPYAYFYQPLVSTDNRVCVKECPAYVSGSIAVLDCYVHACPAATTGYGHISEDGASYVSGSAASTELLYGSYSLMDRICIPNT